MKIAVLHVVEYIFVDLIKPSVEIRSDYAISAMFVGANFYQIFNGSHYYGRNFGKNWCLKSSDKIMKATAPATI